MNLIYRKQHIDFEGIFRGARDNFGCSLNLNEKEINNQKYAANYPTNLSELQQPMKNIVKHSDYGLYMNMHNTKVLQRSSEM